MRTQQWEAWKAHFKVIGDRERLGIMRSREATSSRCSTGVPAAPCSRIKAREQAILVRQRAIETLNDSEFKADRARGVSIFASTGTTGSNFTARL